MAFTLATSGSAGDSSGTPAASIGVNPTGSTTAGSLSSAFAKHEDAATTITVSDGTTTFTAGTYRSNGSANSHGQWHYLLSSNSGDKTYTASFLASRAFPSIIYFEFTYTGTASFDAQNTSTGTSNNPTSGTYTATGTDGIALGGYAENSGVTTSAEQVNGVAADGVIRSPGGNFTSAWRKTYSAGFTAASTGTLSGGPEWACCGLAIKADGVTAAITGTATASITEADVVAGSKTIIITLTGDTWLISAGGLFDAIRQDIINGLDSAQSEGTGWNTEVRDKQGVAGVVRTSDTVVTITLDAQAAYNITAQETITVTVPITALTLGLSPVTGTPTFTVAVVSAGGPPIFNSDWFAFG